MWTDILACVRACIHTYAHTHTIYTYVHTYIIHKHIHTYTCIHTHIHIYTGCPRRNVPDFGRVFLMLKYTNITQNTYVQTGTVTEIMAREV